MYAEWSTIITFDTTRICNGFLSQDCGTVIIGGSNPTSIEIAFSVYIILNVQLLTTCNWQYDLLSVPFDADTTARVYAEV